MKDKYGAPTIARRALQGQSIGQYLQDSGVSAGVQSSLYAEAERYKTSGGARPHLEDSNQGLRNSLVGKSDQRQIAVSGMKIVENGKEQYDQEVQNILQEQFGLGVPKRGNFEDVSSRFDRLYNKRINYVPETLNPKSSGSNNVLEAQLRKRTNNAGMPGFDQINENNRALLQMRNQGHLPPLKHTIMQRGVQNMKNSTSADHILHPSLQVMPSKF